MSFQFGSGDYADATFTGEPDVPFTLMCWIRRSAALWAVTAQDYIMQVDDNLSDNNNSARLLACDGTADTVAAEYWSSSSTHDEYTFSGTTWDDVWVPVIGVFRTDSDRQIYMKDSTLTGGGDTGSKTATGPFPNLRVGASISDYENFGGYIAEVCVWDKALSTSEIDQLWTAAETGVDPSSVANANCIGYWPLSVNQTSHDDESGNGGPTLTITGATHSELHPTITGGGGGGETFNRVLTENTVVTDPVPGYQLIQKRPANSNINLLTDAAFLYYAFARLIVEYLPLTDQYIIEQSLRRDLSEAANLTDAITTLRQYFRDLSDAIEVSDGFTKSITIGEIGTTYSKVRTDVLRVTDSFDAVFLGIVNQEVLDTIAFGEAEFLARFCNRSLAEQIAIVSDLINISRSKVIRDDLLASDSFTAIRTKIDNVVTLDNFALTDAYERDLQYIKRKQLSDVFSVLDSKWFESGTTLEPAVKIETGIEER
jgi:hypothetical protein